MPNLNSGILIYLVWGWPWHWPMLMGSPEVMSLNSGPFYSPIRALLKCTLALKHSVFEEIFLAFALPGFRLSLSPLEIFMPLFHPVYAFHISEVMMGRSLSPRHRSRTLAHLPAVGFRRKEWFLHY